MKNKFNSNKNPRHFNLYMSSLENYRDNLGFSNDYDKVNRNLINEYLSTDILNKRIDIRNKIVMYNIKLVHEILYTKLNVNIFRPESTDIFQEANLFLVEIVQDFLENCLIKNYHSLSSIIYYKVISKLGNIIKKYYDYSEYTTCKSDFDNLEEEAFENLSNHDINLACYLALKDREYYILTNRYIKGESVSEIGLRLGLLDSRVNQILAKACKKVRDYVNNYEALLHEQLIFRKKIDCIRKKLGKKYILILGYNGNHSYFVSELIEFGINPNEWVVVMYPTEKRFKFIGLFKAVIYEEKIPFNSDIIFDQYLYETYPEKSNSFSEMGIFKFQCRWIDKKIKHGFKNKSLYLEIEKFVREQYDPTELEEIFNSDGIILSINASHSDKQPTKEEKIESRKRELIRTDCFDEACLRYLSREG